MKKISFERRFDFFTIWPNGIDHIDDILNILRAEQYLRIISIQKHTFDNIKNFVMDLYACDTVPLRHLESKLEYLYKLKPEVINIFVENFNIQEEYVGTPPYRKTQCKYIVEIKNKIRNLYNPKHLNPEFHVLPLNQGVSHEHVIHASDYEEQVDYYLKMLGHPEGLIYLQNNEEGLAFTKPFYVSRPTTFTYQKVPIRLIKANILSEVNGKIIKKAMSIEDTPHYKALCSDLQIYQDYLHKYRFTYLCDDYSLEKFTKMSALTKDEVTQFPPLLLTQKNDGYEIIDGVHRAAISLRFGIEELDCVILEGK